MINNFRDKFFFNPWGFTKQILEMFFPYVYSFVLYIHRVGLWLVLN